MRLRSTAPVRSSFQMRGKSAASALMRWRAGSSSRVRSARVLALVFAQRVEVSAAAHSSRPPGRQPVNQH